MSRRIDIELTSARDDGTWTWRAAGAKQPRGVVASSLLYDGAQPGDVVRAEADFEIEGITILSVIPPREKRNESSRIEVIGSPRDTPGVTSSLVPKRDRDRDGERRGPRREGGGDRGGRPGQPPRDRGARSERSGERTGGRDNRGERPGGDRPSRDRAESRGPRAGRPAAAAQAAPERPKEKKLNPGNAHRTAAMEALAPEQRPVAEQVLRGGIPAVRTALEAEIAKAREEGRPEINTDAILAMAEQILPRMKSAEWHDRAEAAMKSVDEISLRDLRAVVAGADAAARDEDTRILATNLREALECRVAKQREDWVAEITTALDENRLVRALRVSARPPDAGSRFPTELANRLGDAASAAMSPDITPDRWATLLDAVAGSPVRRSVKPVGLPAEPGEALLLAARQQSGRVPALAAMLGIDMPPPPGPPPGLRGRPGRPGGAGGQGGRPPRPGQPQRPRPPAPPAANAPAPAATSEAAPASAAAPAPAASPEPTAAPVAAAPEAAAAPATGPVPASEAPAPVAEPSTQGTHSVPEHDEPTEVGALASPDPAAEAAVAEAPSSAPEVPVVEAPDHGVSGAAPEADTTPSPAAPPRTEPDSPAEAVAAELLREQPVETDEVSTES